MPNLLRMLSVLFVLIGVPFTPPPSPIFAAGFSTQHVHHIRIQKHRMEKKQTIIPLAAGLDENDNPVEMSEEQDNFDGKGFANYLAPYVLTLVASIAATAGFVKFVLMDY